MKEENLIVGQVLFDFLKEQNLAEKLITNEVDEFGFFIEFETFKNISQKQLSLFEGKILKRLSKLTQDKNTSVNPQQIKFLKLRGVSGIESEKTIVNKIFGFAALKKDIFEKKISEIEELESRDHRKIAKELEIFMIDDVVGKGLPIWLPNGVKLKKIISNFIYEQEEKFGSMQVETPILGSLDLYKKSGHYYHYKESMFPKMKVEDHESFILRPMGCPHHIMIYKVKPRSFRELPFRLAEQTKQYRYEPSGALIGLERVRAMELTDSHVFLREDQIKDELKKAYKLIAFTLKKFGINIEYIELALHDSKNFAKYHGDIKVWKNAEKLLKEFLTEEKISYIEKKGEAAFYGPKIDIQIKTALGHLITISTIQLDFFLPEKFNLTYINSQKEKVRVTMIHRGLIGTFERFISILLEQTKGDLPMWLAPEQAVILPINKKHISYAKKIFKLMKDLKIRVKLDDSDERLSYKIREYQTKKTKTQIIIGDEEILNSTISIRYYGKNKTTKVSIDEIAKIYQVKK